MNLKVFNDKKSLKGLASLFLLLPVFFFNFFLCYWKCQNCLGEKHGNKGFSGKLCSFWVNILLDLYVFALWRFKVNVRYEQCDLALFHFQITGCMSDGES